DKTSYYPPMATGTRYAATSPLASRPERSQKPSRATMCVGDDVPREDGHRMQIERSEALFAQALRVIPGGVNSPVRAFRAVGGQPLFIERGEGAYLYDADGNRYIDYVGSWGPLILGHAHPHVLEAIGRAAAHGTSFGAPTAAEVRLAELVI